MFAAILANHNQRQPGGLHCCLLQYEQLMRATNAARGQRSSGPSHYHIDRAIVQCSPTENGFLLLLCLVFSSLHFSFNG